VILAIIQARLGSTRLPGKVLLDLGGRRVLDRVVEAAGKIQDVDRVVVAWPEDAPNRKEDDVLGRFADVAAREGADVIVRVTSDCPLFDPQVGTLVLRRFLVRQSRQVEPMPMYVSNLYPRRTWPDGMDCEVFNAAALHLADQTATMPSDREHVTPAMQRAFYAENVELPVDWSWVRLTLDTEEDLAWLRTAIGAPRSGGIHHA